MDALLKDEQVVDRILSHVEHGTTDQSETVWREPIEHYLSEDRFQRELSHALRTSPTVFCPSAALPDAGSYVAREAAGVPLIVVRGQDGKVRAFRNACRHRGAELAQEGLGCTRAFVCPYHGWSYRLDGRLQDVPHRDGFPDVDASTHSLKEVKAVEEAGLIFVTQDGEGAGVDPCAGIGNIIAPGQKLLRCAETVIDANWKIHLESFLEGYHIKSTHPDSFLPFGYDNLNVIEQVGRNSRVTFPFQRIESLKNKPRDQWSVDGRLTYVYHLYPNVIVAVLTYHTSVVILEPLSVGQTKQISYALTNHGDSPEAVANAQRDLEFVGDSGAKEDQAMVQSIQRSLKTSANTHFTFGHYEPAIQHFHRNLSAQVSP